MKQRFPTHTLCDPFCFPLGLVVWELNTCHQSCPGAAHKCLHPPSKSRLWKGCFRRLSDRHRLINFEVKTFSTGSGEADPRVLSHLSAAYPSLHCSPAAQPSAPHCWAACAVRWYVMQMQFKGRNKVLVQAGLFSSACFPIQQLHIASVSQSSDRALALKGCCGDEKGMFIILCLLPHRRMVCFYAGKNVIKRIPLLTGFPLFFLLLRCDFVLCCQSLKL